MERGFESWPGKNFESSEPKEPNPEDGEVDLRPENEVFRNNEILGREQNSLAQLNDMRDKLSEDTDGIIRIDLPAYDYDFSTNPFVGIGPDTRHVYQVSRYVDVVFLHRYMYQDILVAGVCSRDYVDEAGRLGFVKHIRDTGGIKLDLLEQSDYDFVGQGFTPFMSYHSTIANFRLRHTLAPGAGVFPHYPLDVWMIFDANCYEEVPCVEGFRRRYRLRQGYDRRSSLVGVAIIN